MLGDSRRLIRLIVVFSVAALAVLALLIVVGTVGGQDTISENPPSDSGNPVIPPADSTVSRSREVQLYFRFGSEGYLACETRLIEARASERLEAAVLRELIRGPSSEHAELTRLIQAQTQIGEISEQGDTLYVTLSADFLRSAVNQPEGWGEDAALVRENFLQRRLAVYSVVNTLSNLGTYSHVQILVDSEGEGVGELLPRRQFGFVDDAASKEKPLPPCPTRTLWCWMPKIQWPVCFRRWWRRTGPAPTLLWPARTSQGSYAPSTIRPRPTCSVLR